jgi:TrmH family RNA methyltransferase
LLPDPSAAKVRGVAKLAKKDARSETGLFLLEGPQGLKEAVNRPKLVVEVFATEDALERYAEHFEKLESARVTVHPVSERALKAMADTATPQGVIAVCEQLDVSLESVVNETSQLIVLLSNIRDPGNAGTVLRAADASGADAVLFSENSVDVYNPKVIRSTAGSIFNLPIVTEVDSVDAIRNAQAAGFQVFAADGGGMPITELPAGSLSKPTLWVFGNEAWGFEPEVLEAADRVVSLPIFGSAESLNLATAASVCLYESAFAQNGSNNR